MKIVFFKWIRQLICDRVLLEQPLDKLNARPRKPLTLSPLTETLPPIIEEKATPDSIFTPTRSGPTMLSM